MALLLFHYPVLPELTRRYRLHDATESHGYLRPLGRPPFLPHWESFFLCLRVVAVPPFFAGPIPDGTGATPASPPIDKARVYVNADIEPDADHDGFGDETQDQCPSDASTAGPCPPPAPPAKDTTPPAISASIAKTLKLSKNGAISFLMTTKEDASGNATGTISLPKASKVVRFKTAKVKLAIGQAHEGYAQALKQRPEGGVQSAQAPRAQGPADHHRQGHRGQPKRYPAHDQAEALTTSEHRGARCERSAATHAACVDARPPARGNLGPGRITSRPPGDRSKEGRSPVEVELAYPMPTWSRRHADRCSIPRPGEPDIRHA